MAEMQAGGRGRRGRDWVSPPGNLYASTIVQLRPADPPAQTLSFVAAWALLSVSRTGVASLKWPNDLIIGDRKLAGILLERSEDIVVAGFGLNVRSAPSLEERKTTSVLEWVDDADADVFRIFEDLQRSFENNLAKWRHEGFAAIRDLWESEGPERGELLRVNLGDGSLVEGSYCGLADDGALQLRLASGRLEQVRTGEVMLIEDR